MHEWLDNNIILIHSTYNEGKSAIAEKLKKTLKAKINKRMTINHGKSYLAYFNKLIDQYNNTYHHSINQKKVWMLITLLWLKTLTLILKHISLKLMIESELLSTIILFVKVTLKIGLEKYLLLILSWKIIYRRFKRRKNNRTFLWKKNCCWGNHKQVINQNQTVILEINLK